MAKKKYLGRIKTAGVIVGFTILGTLGGHASRIIPTLYDPSLKPIPTLYDLFPNSSTRHSSGGSGLWEDLDAFHREIDECVNTGRDAIVSASLASIALYTINRRKRKKEARDKPTS